MRTKNAIYNTLAALAVQLMTFIIGIILPRFILISYGSTMNGLTSSVTQYIRYLYILEMGLNGSIIYSLYKPIADHDVTKINGIMSAAKRSFNQIGLLFSMLLIIAAAVYPSIIQKEHIDTFTVFVLIISIGATGAIDLFTTAKYIAFLSASQHYYVLSLFRIIYLVINTAIMVVLIGLKYNIALIYFISIAANLLNSILVAVYFKKKYPFLSYDSVPDKSALSKRYDVIVHEISAMVIFSVPVLILTMFGSLKEVSVYSVYFMLFSGVSTMIGVFSNGLSSGFGDMIIKNEKEALKKAYSEYEFLYYMIMTVIFSCTMILGLSFIKIYTKGVSDINYFDPVIFALLTVSGILDAWKTPQTTIIIAAGHYRQTRHRAIIEALITIVACTILTYFWGIYGTLSGRIIGSSYRAIDLLYSRKITEFKFIYTGIRMVRMFILAFAIVFPFAAQIKLEPTNFMNWFADAVVVLIWATFVAVVGNTLLEKRTMLHLYERGRKLAPNRT